MQRLTEKKMKVTVVNVHGETPKSKTISFRESSEIYQQIKKLIDAK